MKDIGSIFPLYKKDLALAKDTTSPIEDEGRVLYSLCREALFEIAQVHGHSGKKVLIPAYTCMTVVSPFIEQGWECCFYSIDRQLRIDGRHLMVMVSQFHPDIVVAHPFYGMDFNENEIALLKDLKSKGITLVVDLTQCAFSKQRLPFVDYYVGSLRKWMPMPDGGFLETSDERRHLFCGERDCYTDFATKQTDSMYLRGLYFENGDQEVKDISRRINKDAVLSARIKIAPHRIAPLSYVIMKSEDIEKNVSCRISNFKVLFEGLKGNGKYEPVCKDMTDVTTAPLYFTIYTDIRQEMQKILAESHIYAPVIWPLGTEDMLVSEDVRYIYDHILAIPCDQRYDQEDLNKIINIINSI